MFIVHSDSVFRVEPGTSPDYKIGNSLVKLIGLTERLQLAAERECYFPEHIQYLVPIDDLELYGPAGADADVLDPQVQDNKNDFQKQNVRDFTTTDTLVTRGWARAGNWTGAFLRVSYRAGVDSKLSRAAGHELGPRIKLWLKVNSTATTSLLTVPYNEASDRYELELWSYPSTDLRSVLDEKGRQAFDRGELQARGDLVPGTLAEFERSLLDGKDMRQVSPNHAMHPLLPLHLEMAWADATEQFWDSQDARNYHYEFNMRVRGWDNFLGVGTSPNPHGGVGTLEYRNLFSNYFAYAGMGELGRRLETWNFDASGSKNHGNRYENFLAVDYMDLHILKPNAGIGLHRHRDNQEIFMTLENEALMVVGDWCKFPERERCFELRMLRAGHCALLKGGNLHGLMNPTDEDIPLFMFGGYD